MGCGSKKSTAFGTLTNHLKAGVNMNQTRIARTLDTRLAPTYLTEIVGVAREKYKVPAIAVTLMNSETVYRQEIQGVRVVDKPTQVTLDDYFHIGSCSKSVLAVMAAKLIEQKKITWQTRFFDVLPELKANANNAYSDITLEDLFLCEAGIQAYTNSEAEPFPVYGSSVIDKRLEFMKYLVASPPSSERKNGRFQHLYSNPSYTMASAMLERVCGFTYEELVRKTLTVDLGLSVLIGWPNSISSDQPWGHMIAKGKVESFPPNHEYKLPCLITAAGDLSMSPKDYAKYTQMHLRGLTGRDNYISSEAYHYTHFNHEGFSLGTANGTLGSKRYSAFDGSAGTFFCRSFIIPESDFAITIMMNASSATGSMEAVDWLTIRIVKKHFNRWWKFWL
ncbi:MAG: class A beta-lactamase-related serine hydrolase [Spirochaetaceae bacterium]|nr:MAG: class A beta-lactamase-related serine hydrolase [Spirochaetaceae bacterium]